MVLAFFVPVFADIGGAVATEDLSDPLAVKMTRCNVVVGVLDVFLNTWSASPTGFARWLAVFPG